MTEPRIDDQLGRIHQRALELQDEVVALDTAAHNLDLAFPDRHELPDPPPDLHPRVAEADEALTRYLIEHRDHLGGMPFWLQTYQLLDEDPRVVETFTLPGRPEPDKTGTELR